MTPFYSRRHFLQTASSGFGWLAAASVLSGAERGAVTPQHRPPAKHVILLYMSGGVSQVDSFDPKPRLRAEHGRPFSMKKEPTQFDSNGTVFGSPWEFRPGGKCGLPVSDLFPHIRERADDLCVIRSLTTKSAVHANANFWMHTGSGMLGRPSAGSWVSYGLGSAAENLPSFVVINCGLFPIGGLDCFKSGFLPAAHEASIFDPQGDPVPNLKHSGGDSQDTLLSWVRHRDQSLVRHVGAHAAAVESSILNAELAAKMQTAVPELADLSREPAWLQEKYGLSHNNTHTQRFGRSCLLARRLVERGVRFVEVTIPAIFGDGAWDAHGDLKKNHAGNALAVDQPIAALLEDLKARGLLDETLVLFGTEFGRTPFAQGGDGRDHNEFGFSVWLAGGGARGGTSYGATDDYGYKAVEKPCDIHDLHATVLHLLGLNHEKLTFRFGGRDHRLTDVHGNVLTECLA
jgi:hypothetical protein